MGIHNLVTSAILDWGNIIYITLHVIYLCYKSSSTVCVSIPIQGWHLSTETSIHSGRVATNIFTSTISSQTLVHLLYPILVSKSGIGTCGLLVY